MLLPKVAGAISHDPQQIVIRTASHCIRCPERTAKRMMTTDISARAIEILGSADYVAAEDTRNTGLLFKRLGISRRLTALHEHNERQQTLQLVEYMLAGQSVAVVSDAGTPLINDPGYRLVDAALEADVAVITIPGPSSVIAALSISGQPTDRFCFEGFMPSKSSQRKRFLDRLSAEPRTIVLFESPHRILDSLSDLIEAFGPERSITMARELTKKFETVRRDSLQSMREWIASTPGQTRGEFVLVVAGAPQADASNDDVFDRTLTVLLDQLPLSQAVDLTTSIHGSNRNRVYKRALDLKNTS